MKRVKKLLILEIVLLIIVFLLIIIYFLQSTSDLPYTKIYLTNTSILGRVLGI